MGHMVILVPSGMTRPDPDVLNCHIPARAPTTSLTRLRRSTILSALGPGHTLTVFVFGNSHENFPMGHLSWDCSRANSLNFGVPMEPEASELPKGLVLDRDGNIYIRENTVYNLGSAFDSTLISTMNIGYNPALCNPKAKITPSQSELHRYYQFSADSDSTLQKCIEPEVTMWWKIWVHNYKERKRGWVQLFSFSICFLSQFAYLVVGVRLPPQGLIILGLSFKVRVQGNKGCRGFRGGRGWGVPVNCRAAQLFLYKMSFIPALIHLNPTAATTTLSKSDGSGCSICVNLPVQLDSAMFSK
ncbi:hypothetical protein DVH24_041729 [Malus domestica]|uniref:Uncharacterized protein n=1 Tax=Malus domestica TaxID=3750 RepID=A0A498IU70_MALDO|nr:hypothetical protein DVH24_041729 [Malus domestica]